MAQIKVDNWQEIKTFVDNRGIYTLQFVERFNVYEIAAVDGPFELYMQLSKSPTDTTDLLDFETNYKPLSNLSSTQMNWSQRVSLQSSVDPEGTSLLDIEDKLQKVAREYNAAGAVIIEYKTKLDSTVGATALKRNFNLDENNNIIGTFAKAVEWTQYLEDLVKPPITNISLNDVTIPVNQPSGTKVADIITSGGTPPFTYELTLSSLGRFRIDNGDELTLNALSEIGDYLIEIKATDDAGATRTQQFTISVESFTNTKSALFDGVNDYVQFSDAMDFDYNQPFTFSTWIKPDSPGTATEPIWSKKEVTGYFRGLQISLKFNRRPQFDFNNTGTANSLLIEGTTQLTNLVWQHLVVTHDGTHLGNATGSLSGVKFYLNGVLMDNVVGRNTLDATTVNALPGRIGTSNDGGLLFRGNLQNSAFWNKALSQVEINEMYNSGAPTDLNAHSAAVNLLSWWRLGDGDTFPTAKDFNLSNDGTYTNMVETQLEADTP